MEVVRHGIRHLRIFLAAGWHEGKSFPIPGWAAQTGSPWLTRLFDVYKIRPALVRGEPSVVYTPAEVEEKMINFEHRHGAVIFRDNRMEVVESARFRMLLAEGTVKVLVAYLSAYGLIDVGIARQKGGWYSLSFWNEVSI